MSTSELHSDRLTPDIEDVVAASRDQIELARTDPDELLAQLRQAATVAGTPFAIRLPDGQIVVGRPVTGVIPNFGR